jgi:vacuolar-type H+-ATPase subunit H
MRLFEALRKRKPVEQRSSLAAAIVSQLNKAASGSNLATVCETYFIQSASEARYNHDWLDSSLKDIARYYITSGAVAIHRVDASGNLEALPYGGEDGFSVRVINREPQVFIHGSAASDYEVVTWGARALTDIIAPRDLAKDELALDKIVRDYVQTSIAADEYFRRAIIPDPSVVLTQESLNQLRSSLLSAHLESKGGTMILPARFEVQSFEPLLEALNFEKIALAVESRCAAIYGIPTILLGLQSSAAHSTYANYEQARLSFVHNILVPFWQAIGDAVARLTGEEIALDRDSVQALQESAVSSTVALYERGIITLDEARERLGYEAVGSIETTQQMIEQESEELWYQRVQGSYSLLEQRIASAMRAELSTIVSELETADSVQRELILRSAGRRVAAKIQQAASTSVRSIVRDAYQEARSKTDKFIEDPVAKVVSSAESIIAEIVEHDMQYTSATLYDKLSQEAIVDLAHVALVARTLSTTIVARLQTETWAAMNRLLKDKRRTIKKYWISQRDDKVREHHQEADGQIVPVDGKFKLRNNTGGIELCDHPGDARLSPANRINCRCVLRPRRG